MIPRTILTLLVLQIISPQPILGGYHPRQCDEAGQLTTPLHAFTALDETVKRMFSNNNTAEVKLVHFSSQVVAGTNYRIVFEGRYQFSDSQVTKYIGIEVFVPLGYTNEQPDISKMMISRNLNDVLGYLNLSKADIKELKCELDLKQRYRELYGRKVEGKKTEDTEIGIEAVMAKLGMLMKRLNTNKPSNENTPTTDPKDVPNSPMNDASNPKPLSKSDTAHKIENHNSNSESANLNVSNMPFLTMAEFDPHLPTIESINPTEEKQSALKLQHSQPSVSEGDYRPTSTGSNTGSKRSRRSKRPHPVFSKDTPGSFSSFITEMPLSSFPSFPSMDFIFTPPKHTSMPNIDRRMVFSSSSSYAVNNGNGDVKQSSYSVTGTPDLKNPDKVDLKGAVVENDNGKKTVRIIDNTTN